MADEKKVVEETAESTAQQSMQKAEKEAEETVQESSAQQAGSEAGCQESAGGQKDESAGSRDAGSGETETEKAADNAQPDGTEKDPSEADAETAGTEEPEGNAGSEAEDGSEESGAGKEPKASWAERMAAKKQAKQDKKLDPLKERITELEDRTKRQLAEFENFRKRSEKEKQAMFEIGAKSVIEKILPVIDNFERGLATVPEDKKDDAFVDGMNKVYRQMLTELDKIGVKPIEAVGKEFDPNFHNAVMQVASEEYEAGTVAQELQKGYTYRDSVVRHSMVAVVSE